MQEMIREFDKNLALKCSKTDFWGVRDKQEEFATLDNLEDTKQGLEDEDNVMRTEFSKLSIRVQELQDNLGSSVYSAV